MSCTENFCYNIGEQLQEIRDQLEEKCWSKDHSDILLPREREVFQKYIQCEFLDRRTMEMARCFVQNALKNKKSKEMKQFSLISQQQVSGRVNPERNMITDKKSCGVDTMLSQVRFMGSIAAVLKCHVSPFNMETIKKLLVNPDWRFKNQFNPVQKKAIDDFLQMFHSYIIGMKCANSIRVWSPNMIYTYGLYGTESVKTKSKQFCALMEKFPVVSGQANIREMIIGGQLTPELFLSVIGQLAFTLEMMQMKQGFVHYNLEPDHVCMRPVYVQSGAGITWSYLLYGVDYKMKGLQFIASIRDYSTCSFNPSLLKTGQFEIESAFIGSGRNQKTGLMDFMIAGNDLFVFLSGVRKVILKTLDPSDTKNYLVDVNGKDNNTNILRFIDFVLKDMYNVPDSFFEKETSSKDDIPDLRNNNVLMCSGLGLSPLALLERIQSNIDKVKSLLKVQKLPWLKEERQLFVPSVCKKKIPLFLTDIVPNWKNITNDELFSPILPLSPDEIGPVLDHLLDIEKSKQYIFQFDYRPLANINNQPHLDHLEFYNRHFLQKNGYYHRALENTIVFYNQMNQVLETFYYSYHSQNEELMNEFSKQNNKMVVLMRSVQKTGFVSSMGSVLRFLQTVFHYKKVVENKNCCIATKQTLGNLAQQNLMQQSLFQQASQQQKTRQDIFKIKQQQSACGPKTPLDSYPLKQQQKTKQQQSSKRRQQQQMTQTSLSLTQQPMSLKTPFRQQQMMFTPPQNQQQMMMMSPTQGRRQGQQQMMMMSPVQSAMMMPQQGRLQGQQQLRMSPTQGGMIMPQQGRRQGQQQMMMPPMQGGMPPPPTQGGMMMPQQGRRQGRQQMMMPPMQGGMPPPPTQGGMMMPQQGRRQGQQQMRMPPMQGGMPQPPMQGRPQGQQTSQKKGGMWDLFPF